MSGQVVPKQLATMSKSRCQHPLHPSPSYMWTSEWIVQYAQFSPGFKPCASSVTSTAGRYPNWKLARADGIFWVWDEGMGRQRWDTMSEHGQWWQLVKCPQAQWCHRRHTELPCATRVMNLGSTVMSGSVRRRRTVADALVAVRVGWVGALRSDRGGLCWGRGALGSTATPVRLGCRSCSPGWRGPCCSRASWSQAPESCWSCPRHRFH